ncbi:ankyrin repeat domain-containing protein 13D isoform X1 [Diorhabda carinulata]|uniref:ankyrin repeat domain-containing protein 13D isoform X1 n=1 Tax=Diorhabda carinulata TaxID=1163345 RepID=UPI0025A219AD|nr:ankyrin repeat domain-containing protein 13D isoform X1 [Diorhabda carinulata]XP_057658212.1 ankyrin repeat domain-containing protein 13D isoform X1 [Diorhabda carinulata]XP_057658213.1 ankyrin repeat domain-containing protein 13D isoform X1 [Diorhabda carinulata]
MVTEAFIKAEYPLHWCVWKNDYKSLGALLSSKQHNKEKLDVRGRSPLMLAVTLGHLESTRTLLHHEANVNCENLNGWTVVQEAVATGDPELVQIVLESRDFQRYTSRMAGIPELLHRLKEAPDFYVEMKWEFTSWVPLVSRMCPSDTYKVYKQGSSVRIDTTLLGFDHTSWQRGNRSYVFQGHNDGAVMMEIDHDLQQVYCEQMKTTEDSLSILMPNEESVSQRLTTPIVTTYIDTEKISFERNKAGLWGWRSDKTEVVNGYECKVFSASNVELVTKTRTEHLTETDKARSKNNKHPLQNFLGIAEVSESQAASLLPNEEYSNSSNPCNITPEEYFDKDVDLNAQDRDIGRPKEVQVKVQKFKANLWLCENYPLSLPEQILPIVDLMAISSSHFAKLKDFIQMQLPSGFPVKIEIPLFHILNARITFGNIFAMDADVPLVTNIQEDNRLTCVLDDSLFKCPSGYAQIGLDGRRQFSMEEEDDLLQFAIQQSLIDAGTEREEVDIWEALRAQKPSRPETPNLVGEEDRQLQRAIQASLELYQKNTTPGSLLPENNSPEMDSDLNLALLLSQQEEEKKRQREEKERLEEQKILADILELSLKEK